jgi:hypothetical protein
MMLVQNVPPHNVLPENILPENVLPENVLLHNVLLYKMSFLQNVLSVPDKRSRIHEVVVVRRYSPGYWEFGVGREWGRVEKGEVSLRVT